MWAKSVTMDMKALFILYAVFHLTSSNLPKPTALHCGKRIVIESNTEEIVYPIKKPMVPENMTCSWILNVSSEAYLKASDFYLTDGDNFTIYEDEFLSQILFGPYSGRQGSFVIALTAGEYFLMLQTSLEKYPRAFMIQAYPNCLKAVYNIQNIQSAGSSLSPFYLPGNGNFTCTVIISGLGVAKKPEFLSVLFSDYNITSGALVAKQKPVFDGKYDFVTRPPPRLLLAKNVAFNLTINTEIPNQYLRFDFDLVSEGCSEIVNLEPSKPSSSFSLNVNSEIVWLPLTCRWLVKGPADSEIHITTKALQLVDVQDHILISAPQKYGFEPLVITPATNDLLQGGSVTIPANEVLLKYVSTRPKQGTSIDLTFSIHKSDKSVYEDEGWLHLNSSTEIHPDIKLKVQEGLSIRLSWPHPIPKGAALSFYKNFEVDFEPFLELSDAFKVNFVTLPFNQVTVIARNFLHGNWKFMFNGSSDACDQVKTEETVHFQTGVTCSSICSWIVPPKEKEGVFVISFPKVHLGSADNLFLYTMDSISKSTIANFTNVISIPTINIPARSGTHILVERKCTSGNSYVETVVQLKPSCGYSATIEEGESIQLESPGYPNAYPLNANCTWHLTSPSPMFATLRFNQISLSDVSHSLNIRDPTRTISIHGTSAGNGYRLGLLPKDEILEFPVSLAFQSTLATLRPGNGFLLKVLAFKCGGALTDPDGSLTLSPNSVFCVWSINLESVPHRKTELHLWVNTESRSFLEIYDGDSVRSNMLAINPSGTVISSGPSVIVIYKSAQPVALSFFVQYFTKRCDFSSTCANGRCMQEGWRCNGLNDCGDYSDEKDCFVDHPLPSPPPCETLTQTPFQTSASSGPTSVNSHGKETANSHGHHEHSSTGYHSTESSVGYSAHDHSECVSHTVLALGITGAMLVGLIFGTMVVLIIFRRQHKAKTWLALQSSNTQLTNGDNVSL